MASEGGVVDRVSEASAATPDVEQSRIRQTASVYSILVRLVAAALLPGMVGAAVVLYAGYRSERGQLERDTLQTARVLVQAVDAELFKAQAAAQTLSKSEHLKSKNLAAFYNQAQEVMAATGVGNNFVLSDATGQQFVNTLRPFPGPLPRHGNPEQLRRVFETGRPLISDIYIGGVLRRPVMSIDVPVVIDGRVAYDLSVGLFPERLGDLLRIAGLPPDWVAAVFDTRGVIAARSHLPEKFVGGKGSPVFVERMAQAREGVVESNTLEGIRTVAVFSRSAVSNWSVGIGIPVDVFEAPLRQRFLLLLAAVAILAVVGVALAWVQAKRIARSMRALVAPALALGTGKAVVVPDVGLREAAEVATAIGTVSELLARRTAELEAANAELEEFSYAISHDLRSPLRAIAGFAQIVEEDQGSQLDDDGRRLLTRIRANTVRMGRLIDGLLDFMQISRRKFDPVRVDMAELVRDVFGKLCAAAPERKLTLRVDVLPPAWGDRALLGRALENLIANAMKFIPQETAGLITVTAESGAGENVYHLADNGVGFDMRYAGKLFEVFERVHAPGEFEGVGIGLAIVKRIVGRHGGRVWAEGQVGYGATFHFALPAPH